MIVSGLKGFENKLEICKKENREICKNQREVRTYHRRKITKITGKKNWHKKRKSEEQSPIKEQLENKKRKMTKQLRKQMHSLRLSCICN